MGYATSHKLNVTGVNDTDIIGQLRAENKEARYALLPDGRSNEACNWYDHEKDMRAFSKKHPNVLFCMEGEGEESGDIWKEYYQNGLMQRCKAVITFEEFNSLELK